MNSISLPLSVKTLRRYPIKGVSGEELSRILILPQQGLDGDRRWILATSDMNDINAMLAGNNPWRPWQHGHTLKSNPSLAQLQAKLHDNGDLEIAATNTQQMVRESPTCSVGRQKIEQFIRDFLQDSAVQLADCNQQPAWDYLEAHVSVLFAESVEDLSQQSGREIDERRFRANILMCGDVAHNEIARSGALLCFEKGTILRMIEPISRCRAVDVNPDTAISDMRAGNTLMRLYERNTMGMKCEVVNGGTIQLGEKAQWREAQNH